jgi:hypothetical protein
MVDGRRSASALAVCASALLASVVVPSTPASGQARLRVPEQSSSGPFYARMERGFVHQTDQWVAIAFYRDPECVRLGFNLLNFFDFANIPAIFGCPLTVHGFEVWDDPATDLAPRQSRLQGNGAVPVWFVSVNDFQKALPGLTMAELIAMPSLMQGVASKFQETLHPAGGANRSMIRIVASGQVPDGRTFHYVAVEANGVMRHVAIEFK